MSGPLDGFIQEYEAAVPKVKAALAEIGDLARVWDEAYLQGYRDRRLEQDYDPSKNPYRNPLEGGAAS